MRLIKLTDSDGYTRSAAARAAERNQQVADLLGVLWSNPEVMR